MAYGEELEKITPRLFSVYMLLVTTALPHEHIAQKLDIEIRTVRTYTWMLFNMLGVGSRLEMMIQYHVRENCKCLNQ